MIWRGEGRGPYCQMSNKSTFMASQHISSCAVVVGTLRIYTPRYGHIYITLPQLRGQNRPLRVAVLRDCWWINYFFIKINNEIKNIHVNAWAALETSCWQRSNCEGKWKVKPVRGESYRKSSACESERTKRNWICDGKRSMQGSGQWNGIWNLVAKQSRAEKAEIKAMKEIAVRWKRSGRVQVDKPKHTQLRNVKREMTITVKINARK